MATELCLLSISELELQKFQSDPSLLSAFCEKHDVQSFGANHRNVDIFHFLLNGTRECVPGPLGIFSSWFGNAEIYERYRIDDESFGMGVRDVAILLSALECLTDEKIRERWQQWQEREKIDSAKDDDADFFPESFELFRGYCADATRAGRAIVWVAA